MSDGDAYSRAGVNQGVADEAVGRLVEALRAEAPASPARSRFPATMRA